MRRERRSSNRVGTEEWGDLLGTSHTARCPALERDFGAAAGPRSRSAFQARFERFDVAGDFFCVGGCFGA